MSNFLYISNDYLSKNYGGRQNLSFLLQKVFRKILRKKFYILKLKKVSKNKIFDLISDSLSSNIDGINKLTKKNVIKLIEKNKIKYVFIEGSNLGSLCKHIKLYDNNIKIVVFFHNVETKFFLDSFLFKKTFHSLGVLIANYLAERKSCFYSDKSIVLTKYDKNLIYKIFNKKVNYVLPLMLEDKRKKINKFKIKKNKKYLLFVGSAFYANLKGVTWFVKEVLPKIDFNLAIVGRDFEKFKNLFKDKKIIFLGAAKDINAWYEHANLIISPIFSGSGMKSKVGEAMMFGKKILGTQKSFIGYERVKNKIGYECNTSQKFVEEIKKMQNKKKIYFSNIRKLYKINYSFEASVDKINNIIKNI